MPGSARRPTMTTRRRAAWSNARSAARAGSRRPSWRPSVSGTRRADAAPDPAAPEAMRKMQTMMMEAAARGSRPRRGQLRLCRRRLRPRGARHPRRPFRKAGNLRRSHARRRQEAEGRRRPRLGPARRPARSLEGELSCPCRRITTGSSRRPRPCVPSCASSGPTVPRTLRRRSSASCQTAAPSWDSISAPRTRNKATTVCFVFSRAFCLRDS